MDEGITEVTNYAEETEMEFCLLHPSETHPGPCVISYAEIGDTLLPIHIPGQYLVTKT